MDETLLALSTISCGGAFGGIVLGMVRETNYKVQIPGGNRIEIGFVGDALIGIAASLSVFTVAGPLLNISFTNIKEPQEFIKIIALAILAGFAGISLLQRLSDNLVNKVEKLNNSIEELKLKEKCDELTRRGDFLVENKQYEEAVDCYEHATSICPSERAPILRKGMALKRLGRVQEAYELMNKHIKEDPESSSSYYNRACYGTLLGHELTKILFDLEIALKKSKWCQITVKKDPDFDSIRHKPDFVNLVAEYA